MPKKRKRFLALLFSFLLVVCAGCSVNKGAEEKTEAQQTQAQINENILEEIRDRGYLIVGCKTDVPDLSYYNEETESFEGLEIELAYKTAAKIFDVEETEAREKELVHFVGVTVADREEKLESGQVDCLFATYSITKERAKRFALSSGYYIDYIGLMVKYSGENPNSLGSGDLSSISDLDGKYIGVPRNATTREDFLSYIDTMNTIKVSPIFCEYESYENLFKALKDGHIDVMAVDVSILNGYVDNTTKILEDRFAGQHYGAAAKQENKLLIDCVDQVLSEE